MAGKYFPYGQERPSATTDGTDKFATYFRDSETGLDYAHDRYHQPGMGRFMTADPYRASGGRAILGAGTVMPTHAEIPSTEATPPGCRMKIATPISVRLAQASLRMTAATRGAKTDQTSFSR